MIDEDEWDESQNNPTTQNLLQKNSTKIESVDYASKNDNISPIILLTSDEEDELDDHRNLAKQKEVLILTDLNITKVPCSSVEEKSCYEMAKARSLLREHS